MKIFEKKLTFSMIFWNFHFFGKCFFRFFFQPKIIFRIFFRPPMSIQNFPMIPKIALRKPYDAPFEVISIFKEKYILFLLYLTYLLPQLGESLVQQEITCSGGVISPLGIWTLFLITEIANFLPENIFRARKINFQTKIKTFVSHP